MRARSLAASIGTVLLAGAWSLVPVAPAFAAAGLNLTGMSVVSYPNGLWVGGTATCSTNTGTGVIDVTAYQVFMGADGSGVGSTTASCADQPIQWSVFVEAGLCSYPGTGTGCFLGNSYANAWATLTRNGVQEAFDIDGFPT